MKVILVSGKAQHGKDTVAGLLRKELEAAGHKVLVTHYADLLKYICKTFFGWDGKKDEAGRHILQYVGTDVVRKVRPDLWVDFIREILEIFPDEWDYVIVPDTRFPNEVTNMKREFHATHLRVVRDNFVSPLTAEQQAHPSETALDNAAPDCWIHNSGSLDDLRLAVQAFVKENLYGN